MKPNKFHAFTLRWQTPFGSVIKTDYQFTGRGRQERMTAYEWFVECLMSGRQHGLRYAGGDNVPKYRTERTG